jgi:hypothetical protein
LKIDFEGIEYWRSPIESAVDKSIRLDEPNRLESFWPLERTFGEAQSIATSVCLAGLANGMVSSNSRFSSSFRLTEAAAFLEVDLHSMIKDMSLRLHDCPQTRMQVLPRELLK